MIDICLATYNGARYLPAQLESIENQSFSDWRVVFSDDGSTDGTCSIIEKKCESSNSYVDATLDEKKHSVIGNFLYLLSVSGASYVMFSDQDDYWLPGKVEKTFKRMLELESEHGSEIPLLVYTDSEIADSDLSQSGGRLSNEFAFNPKEINVAQLLVGNVVQGCTMMLNRAAANMVSLLSVSSDSEFEFHDHLIAAAVLSAGFASYIDEPTLLYRIHSGNADGVNKTLPLSQRVKGLFKRFASGDLAGEAIWRETRFVRRATELLQLGIDISDSKRDVLEELSSYASLGLSGRLKLIKKYGLIRRTGLYGRACQLFGLLAAQIDATSYTVAK